MNTVQRIAKNTGVLLISQIASYIIGFFFIVYTARYLGAEGFGILSFALAFTGIFGVFSDLGLSTLTVREVARDKSLASKYLGNIAVMKIILVVITFVLIALTINLLGYPEQTIKVVYLVALSVIFASFSQMFYSIFQAYEKMEYQSVGQILSSALMLTGALFAIFRGLNVVGFASIYFLVSALVLGYGFVVCVWKFVLLKTEIDFSFWKSTINKALPFGLSSIFVIIYFYIDTVMLSLMKGDAVVGWYSASYRLVYILLFIPSAYFSSVYPIMSRFYKTSEGSLKFGYEHSFRYMMIMVFPIGIGVTLLADKIILLIYGSEFAPSIIALQILIWAVFCSYMSHAPMYFLYSINKQIIYTKVVFLCMILNIIFNLLLIPKMSYIGASIATVITEFIAFLLLFGYAKAHQLGTPVSYKFITKLTICTISIGLFIIYLNDLIGLGLTILGSIVVYLFSLWLFHVFSEEDILIIKRLLKAPTSGKSS